jgi:hypothetical protein
MGGVRPMPPTLPPLQILQHLFPQHLVRPRYARPSSLTNAQVLERSLALNHERVAWLRKLLRLDEGDQYTPYFLSLHLKALFEKHGTIMAAPGVQPQEASQIDGTVDVEAHKTAEDSLPPISGTGSATRCGRESGSGGKD